MRVSLGVTRWQIVDQLAAECVSLSIIAGALGFGLAVYFVRLFIALSDDSPWPYWLHWTVVRAYSFFL